MKFAILSALLAVVGANFAAAQTLDSKHGDWEVYTDGDNSCYIASTPIKEDGNWAKRAQPYVLVNFKKGAADEVNVTSGYPYKAKLDLELKVDKKNFVLFVDGEHGWAKDSATDKAIVSALKNGNELTIKGVSAKGTYSVDTYSLKGISKAYKRMVELCK